MRLNRSQLSIARVAYVALGAFVLVVTWNGFRIGGGSVANVFLALAFAAFAVQTVVARRPVVAPPWLLAAGFGLALAAMLNVIFPPDSTLINQILIEYRTAPGTPLVPIVTRSDVWGLVQFEIAVILIPVMIASVATTPARIERLLDLFVLSAAANAMIGVLDVVGFPVAPIDTGTSRTAGLTIHPNYLALTCTVAAPLALLWFTRGGRWKIVGFGTTGLLLLGAWGSGSRAGAVSTILAIALTVLLVPRLRGRLGLLLPLAGMAVLFIVLAYGDEILEQIRFSSDTATAVNTAGSNSERAKLAEIALEQFEARPLQGVGFGVIADAHSIYLQLLAAGGLIALASFLVFLGGLLGSVQRAVAGPQREAATAAGVAVLVWLLNGTVDNQVADKYLYVIPGLLLAMACVATVASPHPKRSPAVPPRATRTGAPSPAGVR